MVVKYFYRYKVNGYRFHTKARNEGKATYNCGVCVKGVGEGVKYQGIIMAYFMKLFMLNLRMSQLKNVYFLIVNGLTRMFLRGYIILNLPHILRLIISDVIESLTHSYLLILQPKWYILSTLRDTR